MPIDPTPGVPTPGDGLPRPHPRPHPRPSKGEGPGSREQAQKPRATKRVPSELENVVRDKVKALPGSLTYIDLIRRNKRDSVLLILAMVALGMALGFLVGSVGTPALSIYLEESWRDEPVENPFYFSLVPGLIGAGIMLVITGGNAIWAWFSGSNAMLRMVHAKEITKELDPELFNVVDEMRIAAGIPMPRIYLIPESALNAFATGRDPERGVVAITTGLRARLTRDELQGVMAHELAHIRHYDIRFSMLMAMMAGLIVVASEVLLRAAVHGGAGGGGRRRSGGSGGHAALVLAAIGVVLAIVAPIAANLIQMAYSRRREYLADAGAAELTRNPEGLASALKKLAEDKEPLVETANRGMAHMFIMNPLRKKKSRHERGSVFSSHPPVADRIAKLIALTR